jgi:hypothetical protein
VSSPRRLSPERERTLTPGSSIEVGRVAAVHVLDKNPLDDIRDTNTSVLPANRLRAIYIALALGTIAIGLFVHLWGTALGTAARDVIGDALWAAMITWWVSALAPDARRLLRAAVAYAVCVGIEVSQLYHAPAFDAVRATRVGHLFLGSGFDPRDLAAYALGVAGAMLLDVALVTRGARN